MSETIATKSEPTLAIKNITSPAAVFTLIRGSYDWTSTEAQFFVVLTDLDGKQVEGILMEHDSKEYYVLGFDYSAVYHCAPSVYVPVEDVADISLFELI